MLRCACAQRHGEHALAWKSEDLCATARNAGNAGAGLVALRVLITPDCRSLTRRILLRSTLRITHAGRATYIERAGTYRPRHAPKTALLHTVLSRCQGGSVWRVFYSTFKFSCTGHDKFGKRLNLINGQTAKGAHRLTEDDRSRWEENDTGRFRWTSPDIIACLRVRCGLCRGTAASARSWRLASLER